MKIIIFAGGHGTRLWPISKSDKPKQFAQIFDGKSTFELAVDRVQDIFGLDNIYVSTNEAFKDIIKELMPQLKDENIFLEPEKRDLAAAIGLSFMKIKESGYDGPIAILWADHLMKNTEEFQTALTLGEELIRENPERIVFLGEKPRFPNHNLGWVTVGDKIDVRNNLNILEFKSWNYRPPLEKAQEMFASGKSLWNPGYFVTSVKFVVDLYIQYKGEMYQQLKEIVEKPKSLKKIYHEIESISFDDAILTQMKPEQAIVIQVDMGWSDPGTLYALKEALEETPDSNVVRGNVSNLDTKDSLVYNAENEKLVTTIGLDGIIVVNTKDTVLVVHKDHSHKVKDLVNKLKEEGLEEYI